MLLEEVNSTNLAELTGKVISIRKSDNLYKSLVGFYCEDKPASGFGIFTSESTIKAHKKVLDNCTAPTIKFLYNDQIISTNHKEIFDEIVSLKVSNFNQTYRYTFKSTKIYFW